MFCNSIISMSAIFKWSLLADGDAGLVAETAAAVERLLAARAPY
jgi:hypothetical protein